MSSSRSSVQRRPRSSIDCLCAANFSPRVTFTLHQHPPSLPLPSFLAHLTLVVFTMPSIDREKKSEQYDRAQPQGRRVHGLQHRRAAPVDNAHGQSAAAGKERDGGARLRCQPGRWPKSETMVSHVEAFHSHERGRGQDGLAGESCQNLVFPFPIVFLRMLPVSSDEPLV